MPKHPLLPRYWWPGGFAIVVIGLLFGWVQSPTLAQINPLTIDAHRAEAERDRISGQQVVLEPGRNVFTVQVDVEAPGCATIQRQFPADIAILLDVSASMAQPLPDGVSRLQAAQNGIGSFLALPQAVGGLKMNSPDRDVDLVGLWAFAQDVTPLTNVRRNESEPFEYFIRDSVYIERQARNTISRRDENALLSPALDAARTQFDFVTRDLSSVDPDIDPVTGEPVFVIITDGEFVDDPATIQAALEVAERRIQPALYVVLVGNADPARVQAFLQPDGLVQLTQSADTESIFTNLVQQIRPRVAAGDVQVTYTLNTADVTLRPETIIPSARTVSENTIEWPAYSYLLQGDRIEFNFEVSANRTGEINVGRATVNYRACTTDEARPLDAITVDGPRELVVDVTPTPLPTITPTATPTPLPTASADGVAQPPTAVPFTDPASNINVNATRPVGGGVGAFLCDPGIWVWLPLIVAVLFLLFVLWNTVRGAVRISRLPEPAGCRAWLCFLIKTLVSLWAAFVLFLFLQPVSGQLCTMPESIYFWRLDGTTNGIFVTNENVAPDDAPAQVAAINEEANCVGCHVASAASNRVAAIAAPPVPGRLLVLDLQEDTDDEVARFVSDLAVVYADFSPDGNNIVLSTGSADLYIVAADGTTPPRQLTNASDGTFGAVMPAWSADGNQIIYVRAPRNQISSGLLVTGNSEIYITDINDMGAPQPLVTTGITPGLNYYPSISGDGRWLAYTNNPLGTTTYSAPEADIWLMDLTTFTVSPLTVNDATASDSWPRWSSDSTRLSFNTTRFDPSFDIVITDIDEDGTASNLIALPGASFDNVFEHLPVWGPPPTRPDLLQEWVALLPFLLPFLLLLALPFICRQPPARKQPESVDMPELKPVTPEDILGPRLDLPGWNGIDVLWEPQKALVIGLGKGGWHVLTQLKKTLYDAGLGKLSDNVQLLGMVAGDETDLIDAPTFSGMPLDDDEMIRWQDPLGNLADDARRDVALNEWVDSNYLTQTTGSQLNPRVGLRNNRMLGRMLLINNLRGNRQATGVDLWQQLRQKAQAARDGSVLKVILVGDTSDDVASGTLLDIAYMLRRLEDLDDIPTVYMVTHVMTEKAMKANINDVQPSVNTIAFMRELARFQLAGGAPFPMNYSDPRANTAAPDDPGTELDGEWSRPLFDELYVHDGQNSTGTLNAAATEQGIYPALADAIGLWLDKAADRGRLDTWRSERIEQTQRTQIQEGRLMLGGMGIYQYRLPFADILEEVVLRYTRELLQFLLMGRNNEVPRLDPALATDRDLGTDLPTITGKFLDELAGSENLDLQWRRVFAALRQRNADALQQAASGLRLDNDRDDAAWQNWLSHSVEIILNGSNRGDDVIAKRGAKIGLAYGFLNQLATDGGVLDQYSRMLQEVAPGNPAVDRLQDFKAMTIVMRDELRATAKALGVNGTSQSLYQRLQRHEADIKERNSKRAQISQREYLTTDERGRLLSEVWYETYLREQIPTALRQMTWQIDGTQPNLMMLIPGEEGEEPQPIYFDPGDPASFEEALYRMGRYFAREVRDRETLSAVLAQTKLRDDTMNDAVQLLRTRSALMLGGTEQASEAAAMMRLSYVLSANERIHQADDLSNGLKQTLRRPDDLKKLTTTDPYSLTVIQTVDTISPETVTSLRRNEQTYLREIHENRGVQPTAIYPAEANALYYEKRLREIDIAPRIFNPIVVTSLAWRRQTEVYLLAFAAAALNVDPPEWGFDRSRGIFVTMEELLQDETITQNAGAVWLFPNNEEPKFCRLVDALFVFAKYVSRQRADEIYERYELDDDLSEALVEWARTDSADWHQHPAFAGCNSQIIDDYIAITRLLIRDLYT